MEDWNTDLSCFYDVVAEEERKDKLIRFIKYCRSVNPGYLALAVCINGGDIYESLSVFCDIHTNLGNGKRKRTRKDCVEFNAEKFRKILAERKITQKALAKATGVDKHTIANIFYKVNKRKSRKFVQKIETALNLPSGSLIVGG